MQIIPMPQTLPHVHVDLRICLETWQPHIPAIIAKIHHCHLCIPASPAPLLCFLKHAAPELTMPPRQAVLIKMSGWVTCMNYAASARVGDFGTLYAADAAAAIVKINPCIVDGPNVWKETSQIQWKLTGAIKDPKLSMLLAFR